MYTIDTMEVIPLPFFHTQNIKSNQTFDIALYYSPIWFKIWRPSFTIDFTKPFFGLQ